MPMRVSPESIMTESPEFTDGGNRLLEHLLWDEPDRDRFVSKYKKWSSSCSGCLFCSH